MNTTATRREMARPSRARVIGAQIDRAMMTPQFARGLFGVLTCAIIFMVAFAFSTERASFVITAFTLFATFCFLFIVGALLVNDETATKLNAQHRARVNKLINEKNILQQELLETVRERDQLQMRMPEQFHTQAQNKIQKRLDFGGRIWVPED